MPDESLTRRRKNKKNGTNSRFLDGEGYDHASNSKGISPYGDQIWGFAHPPQGRCNGIADLPRSAGPGPISGSQGREQVGAMRMKFSTPFSLKGKGKNPERPSIHAGRIWFFGTNHDQPGCGTNGRFSETPPVLGKAKNSRIFQRRPASLKRRFLPNSRLPVKAAGLSGRDLDSVPPPSWGGRGPYPQTEFHYNTKGSTKGGHFAGALEKKAEASFSERGCAPGFRSPFWRWS